MCLLCSYLLEGAKVEPAPYFLPLTTHSDKDVRKTAFWKLRDLPNKKDYIDVFIKGLHDTSHLVIQWTLQALEDVKDDRLLPHYKSIAERFPEEEGYVLSHLCRRHAEYGLTIQTLKNVKV